jgi:glycogen(starch) synthase
MRVLHVLDVSAPTIVGYATRSRAIVNVQRSLGLEPVVLTSPRHKNDGRANLEELDGIPHYRTLKPSVRNPVVEMYWLRQRILEVARQERVDLIHAHSPILTGIPAWMAARQLGLPSIYEIRALWEDGAVDKGACTVRSLRYRLSRGAETFLARSVDAVVCICEGLRRELNARGLSANRLHVVQNGVNTSRFILRPPDPAIQAQLGLTGQTVIGFVGSLFGYEGVVDLVEALAQLIKQGRKDLVGLIVGSGEALSSCRQIAESHGLSNQIQHLGQVAAEDVE